MEKRTRRSRSEVLQDKLAKLNTDKEKYTQKLDSITKQIEELQEELNAQRIDEVLSVIQEQGLSIDQAIERLRG
jgi:predicted  nucleic acid-binding Zn-ribbon protein